MVLPPIIAMLNMRYLVAFYSLHLPKDRGTQCSVMCGFQKIRIQSNLLTYFLHWIGYWLFSLSGITVDLLGRVDPFQWSTHDVIQVINMFEKP